MDENMQHEQENNALPAFPLSETWQQLLGNRADAPLDPEALATLRESIPTIESDPWSALLHAKGVEVVDLTQVHLDITDSDVEQLLQLMQEPPDQHNPNPPNFS
jgi:hypothetical protein